MAQDEDSKDWRRQTVEAIADALETLYTLMGFGHLMKLLSFVAIALICWRYGTWWVKREMFGIDMLSLNLLCYAIFFALTDWVIHRSKRG